MTGITTAVGGLHSWAGVLAAVRVDLYCDAKDNRDIILEVGVRNNPPLEGFESITVPSLRPALVTKYMGEDPLSLYY